MVDTENFDCPGACDSTVDMYATHEDHSNITLLARVLVQKMLLCTGTGTIGGTTGTSIT